MTHTDVYDPDLTDDPCGLDTPLWRSTASIPALCALAGATAAALTTAYRDHGTTPAIAVWALGGALIGALAGALLYLLSGRYDAGTHHHCTVCGQCSILAGIPGSRTTEQADQRAIDAGWLVRISVPGRNTPVTLCPHDLAHDFDPGQAQAQGYATFVRLIRDAGRDGITLDNIHAAHPGASPESLARWARQSTAAGVTIRPDPDGPIFYAAAYAWGQAPS